jgi:hypothetical protein
MESETFFSHVFNFETDSRNEMVNIIQYTVIAVVFIVLLNKLVQTYMPDLDKEKGTLALMVEIMIQCIVLFVGILFIHRIITFIPTFSGAKYAEQNVITVILPTLIVLLSISNLGEKVSYLLDRFMSEQKPVKLQPKQPLSPTNTPQLLPQGVNTSNPVAIPEPDFNTMFSGPTNPLQNAATPGQESFEPMPSNFGGSIF